MGLKKLTVAIILMIILAISLTFTTLQNVEAIGVSITSITPTSHRGKVGDTVRVLGTINTTNGEYRLWFNNYNVTPSGAKATGNNINTTFMIPHFPQGNYTITLLDFEKSINATTWFYIDPTFYVEPKKPLTPLQLQEGDNVYISVNITGGKPDTVYIANVSVHVPTPANKTYWTLLSLSNTTTTGDAYNTTALIYPSSFSGALSTNYTGTYTVAFNKTLGTDSFFVGLTDRSEYHRNQFVSVKAVGYKLSENVTIRFYFSGQTLNSSNATATPEGVITANWAIPSNATIGTYSNPYNVNITSTSPNATIKNPSDKQSFTVPGFSVNVTTKSRAGENVSSVALRTYENGKSVLNVTSSTNGLALMKLEIGDYMCRAFYKGEKVGELPIIVANATSLDFLCNLTNMKISVVTKMTGADIPIPDVKIYLRPENTTLITNMSGIITTKLLLSNHTYVLNASRYGVSFGVTNITTLFINGTAVGWYNVTLICPTFALRVNTTKTNDEPIANIKIKVNELMGGLNYENSTNNAGIAIFNCTFGRYEIEAYDSAGIKLNETTIDLFQNKNVSVQCKLYGLNLSIRVVDYLGQPISNVNVKLEREGHELSSSLTQSDGLATFNNVTGGSLQASIYLSSQTQPDITKSFFADNSITIEVKSDGYVVLAGFPIKTSYLATVIIIIVAIILVLLVEVYRRKRPKLQKSSDESSNKE